MYSIIYRNDHSYKYWDSLPETVLPNDKYLFYEFLWFCHKNNYENNIKYMETKDEDSFR